MGFPLSSDDFFRRSSNSKRIDMQTSEPEKKKNAIRRNRRSFPKQFSPVSFHFSFFSLSLY